MADIMPLRRQSKTLRCPISLFFGIARRVSAFVLVKRFLHFGGRIVRRGEARIRDDPVAASHPLAANVLSSSHTSFLAIGDSFPLVSSI
jgi:hypothetical protein